MSAGFIQLNVVASIMPRRDHADLVECIVEGGYRYSPAFLGFN